MKETLVEYMHRRNRERRESTSNPNITSLELDLLMGQWADEFYNDGSKHFVLGNKVIVSK